MPPRLRLILLLTAAFVLAAFMEARAAGSEDVAAIRGAIEAAIAAQGSGVRSAALETRVGAIDPRLRLPACPALDVALPPLNAAAVTARVSCDAPRWSLYVPVRLHAWVHAVVAATNLAPGTVLAATDLSLGRVDMFATAGAVVTTPAEAEGKVLRTGVPAGVAILAPLLDLPIVVHRGQKVVLTLEDNAMTIRTTAVALEDGHSGQSIMVENAISKKAVRATVIDGGSVEMQF